MTNDGRSAPTFFLRIVSLFRNGRAEHELAREMNAHLALLEDQFVAEGMSPADARLAARRAFGGVDQAKEQQRDARSFRWIDDLQRDVALCDPLAAGGAAPSRSLRC